MDVTLDMSSNLSGTTPRVLRTEAEFLAEIDRLEKRITDLETVCRGLKEENDELTKVQAWLQEEAAILVEESQQLALVDALTNIPNRRALHGLMHRRMNSPDIRWASFAYFILDLDNLKQINDTTGHAAGDDAIKRCARLLEGLVSEGDIVARYGGDEFVMVLDGASRETVAEDAKHVLLSLKKYGLTASIGISFFPEDGQDEAALFTAADRALYTAKEKGKNRYSLTLAK
jgi:diguanylate cyclase (GGDEF)-like protein